MASQALPLNLIVDVEVLVSPQAPAQPQFNQGLIVGSSTVISGGERVREYATTDAMLTDGFQLNSPEYLAALEYFGQSPAPQILKIGRQDLTQSETPLQAIQACRTTDPLWYMATVLGAVKADHEAIATWVESATPRAVYIFVTADSDALSGANGNVLSTLKAAGYKRSMGIYSTTQGSSAPNNAYAAAAVMGKAMGLNTGLPNSYFTLKFKPLTGIITEPLTLTQVTTIEGNNGNLFVNYANDYSILEQGVMADGQFFDEILNLDMLASAIQFNIMNLLVGNPAIPITDAGMTILLHGVNQACDDAVSRGFIASGVWEGQTIFKLNNGDPLPKGYISQCDRVANQSSSDRQARKAMPIIVSLIEAEAAHSVTISVNVQR